MMLDFLGHHAAHDTVMAAIEVVLADPAAPKTPDLGGTASCAQLGQAIAEAAKMPA